MEKRSDELRKSQSDSGQAGQSIEMATKEDNKRDSIPARGVRSMSIYSSQFIEAARSSNYAFFCLSETNPIRKLSKYVVESKTFEYFILLAIGANCIVLALNRPLPENDRIEMADKLDDAELYFIVIFCLEAFMKILAYGFVLHPGSYLRNGWNILDFVVVVIGVLSLKQLGLFKSESMDVKALRAVRVLRPLKLISGVPSLQVVMKSIMRAMVPLLQILLLILFVITIYAIIGLEFFMTKFHSTCYNNDTGAMLPNPHPCNDEKYSLKGAFTKGVACPKGYVCRRYWVGPNDGISVFDNIALAMLTVFQCITMEGWTDIMYWTFQAVDKSGYVYSFYYVSLVVLGSFFMLNLVLGVLSGEFAKERERVETRREFFKVRRQQQVDRQVDAYIEWIEKAEEAKASEDAQKEAEAGNMQLHESQSHLVHVCNPNNVLTMQVGNGYRLNLPKREGIFGGFLRKEQRFRFRIRHLVKSQAFYWIVIICVFLNTIVLAIEHHGQDAFLEKFEEISEIVFLFLFFIEMCLKMYGLGISRYFSSSFNCFDCVVVISGIIEMPLQYVYGINLGVSVLRCLRLLRVFKVTKHWSSLKNLATSLVSSIKSIVSLIFLLFLFILIAALLGMQFFGGKFSKELNPPRTNFDNFQNSMLAVFQILTGEDWNAVMYSGVKAYGGPKDPKGVAVSLYFVLLVIVGNYTLLNVFLAIAVDNLANSHILTADEEAEQKERENKRSINKEKYSSPKEEKKNGWTIAKGPLPAMLVMNHLKKNTNKQKEGESLEENLNAVGSPTINGDRRISKGLNKRIQRYQREMKTQPPLPEDEQEDTAHDKSSSSHQFPEEPNLEDPTPDSSDYPAPTALDDTAQNNLNNSASKNQDDPTAKNPDLPGPEMLHIQTFPQEIEENIRDTTDVAEPDKGVAANNDGLRRRKIKGKRRMSRGASQEDGDARETGDEDEDKNITSANFLRALKGGKLGKRRRAGLRSVPMIKTRTMFIFSPENWLRRVCHQIVNMRHFDSVMLVVIFLSSILIALENPVDEEDKKNKILVYFDFAFTAIFALEVVLKIIDTGVILHKGAYLRNWWNVIDAFVVACNIASLSLMHQSGNKHGTGQSTVRALRVFRVLRPLKSIHKIKKLQAVFRCMWYSIKNVANILMITGLFLFIFSVMGVQLFRGKFFYCTDAYKRTEPECKGQYYDFKFDDNGQPDENPEVKNRTWKRRDFHFDNVWNAMLTLYTSSTGEGWPGAMQQTMDTTAHDRGPVQNHSEGYAVFYIAFVVVFNFFFLNIFVALIILTFHEEGEREIVDCELDRNQRDCVHFAMNAKPMQRFMPSDHTTFSYKVWVVVASKPFEIFIMVLIALNTVVLMMQYEGQSKTYKEVCDNLNIAFTVLFTLEAILKLTAYRLNYFRDPWNIFDFIIVLGSLLDIIVTQISKILDKGYGLPFDPSMFRLFRAARLIKILRQGYTIRILLWTFLQSFKALPYVTMLILLNFFMYAVVGMQLFGKIALDPEGNINDNNNFRGIIQALQVLFRSATGENWHLIMLACFTGAPCDPKVKGSPEELKKGCGNTAMAIIYFCSFIFICMFLMLNLFVAVIMDNFEYLTRDESILGPHHLDEFVRVWSDYDPGATSLHTVEKLPFQWQCFFRSSKQNYCKVVMQQQKINIFWACGRIHHSEVYRLMCHMSPPVGFGKKCPKIVGYKRLIKMNMPLNDDGTVSFSTTLLALIRTSLNIKLGGNMNANDTELRKMIKRVWPRTTRKVLDTLIPKQAVLSSQQMTVGKIYCAKLIHENYKYMKKKQDTQNKRPHKHEEDDIRGSKRGLFLRLVGSIRKPRKHLRNKEDEEIGLEDVGGGRARSHTVDSPFSVSEQEGSEEHARIPRGPRYSVDSRLSSDYAQTDNPFALKFWI